MQGRAVRGRGRVKRVSFVHRLKIVMLINRVDTWGVPEAWVTWGAPEVSSLAILVEAVFLQVTALRMGNYAYVIGVSG